MVVVMNVGYKSGVSFNQDYYFDSHVPLVADKFGPFGLQRVEVQTVVPSPDGVTPPYQIMFRAYFETMEDFQVAQDEVGAEVRSDVPNYYDGAPDIFIGELIVSQ